MKKLLAISTLPIIVLLGCGQNPDKQNRSDNTLRCQKLMKSQLNFPNSYSQDFLDGISYSTNVGMYYDINLKFKAKNAFGMETQHYGTCNVSNGKIVDFSLN